MKWLLKFYKVLLYYQINNNINPYAVNILPNIIFAVKPLPTPLSSDENLINIWFFKDFIEDGAEYPITELNNSSLSLPPL